MLEAVFQREVEVFVSEYISPGENWVQRIQEELKQSQIGIVCLTHDNFQTPWLLIEAGAVAIALGSERILVPYAVDAMQRGHRRATSWACDGRLNGVVGGWSRTVTVVVAVTHARTRDLRLCGHG